MKPLRLALQKKLQLKDKKVTQITTNLPIKVYY
jgi:hypothetical protein